MKLPKLYQPHPHVADDKYEYVVRLVAWMKTAEDYCALAEAIENYVNEGLLFSIVRWSCDFTIDGWFVWDHVLGRTNFPIADAATDRDNVTCEFRNKARELYQEIVCAD